jgi:predicted dehydrogenase
MKDKPIGIGIVGLGNRGKYFARSWNHHPRCSIVACCECDAGVMESARAAIDDDSIDYYSDLKQMLADDNVDAVVVATHEKHHMECGIAALNSDKHLFLEKPMAQTIEDCDALIQAWENTDTVFMVGLELRCCSLCRTMKEILDRGEIGEVKIGYAIDNVSVGGDYYFHGFRRRRQNTVSLQLEKGVHTIDLMNWFVNSTPVRVYSEAGLDVFGGGAPNDLRCPECERRNECSYSVSESGIEMDYGVGRLLSDGCVYAREIDIEDNSITTIRYANGAKVIYGECHFAPDYNRHFTLIGPKGRMIGFYNNEQEFKIELTYRHSGKREIIFPQKMEGSHGGGDLKIHQEFLFHIERGRHVCPGVLGARNAAAVAIMAEEASRRGQVQTIKPYQRKNCTNYPP